jgi:hypothetical protein
MSKKAELIEKRVFLARMREDGDIVMSSYSECYLFKDTYSIRDGWNYYCKNKDYFATNNYCMVINLDKKEEAIKKMVSLNINFLKDILSEKKNSIVIIENKLNKLTNYEL